MKKILQMVLLCLLFISFASHLAADDAATFTTQPAWQTVTLTGFSRARHHMHLATEMAGKVTSIKADVGDTIGKDGIFACLDATFTRLDLESNKVEQARLRTEIAYLNKETERLRQLVRKNTAAQSEFDRLEQNWRDAQYQLQARQVEARYLQAQLQRFCIKAPVGWRLTSRLIEVGQWLSVGQSVGELGDFQTLLVPYALTAQQYLALQQQIDELQVSLPDYASQVPARIERIAPQFDPQTRKINVDLLLSEALPVQQGGIRTQLQLRLPDRTGTVVVPRSAVLERYEEYFLVRPDGEQVQVVKLATDAQTNSLLVNAEQVQSGQVFLLIPQ